MKKEISIISQIIINLLIILLLGLTSVNAAEETMDSQKDKDVFVGGSYRLSPGDTLEIITWKEPDFSRDVVVRHDGFITFPMLDDILAAGLTPMELKQKIQSQLTNFVTDPVVTVTVKGHKAKKFYILGEINKTGEYELDKKLTVLQAFAIAGGFTEWASKKEILLLRRINGEDRIITINYKNIVKGVDLDQNIYVEPEDTIVVP